LMNEQYPFNCTGLVPETLVEHFPNVKQVKQSDVLQHLKTIKRNLGIHNTHFLTTFALADTIPFIPVNNQTTVPSHYYGIHYRMESDMLVMRAIGYYRWIPWLEHTKRGINGKREANKLLQHQVLNTE